MSSITVTVVRYNSAGELRNSKPCANCLEYLIEVGVRYVIYSDENGNLVKTKPRDIANAYTSSGFRKLCREEN